jgi:sugar/nucleoside kinase (ribokinase family)
MKILGIGNALVDILVSLNDEDFLKQFNLPKGSMQLVDAALSDTILKEVSGLSVTQASGGSAANTIHGLASLRVETAFIGSVGNDDLGNFFADDMDAHGIKTMLQRQLDPSGKAITLITPDSERTFATFLGAAGNISAQQLSPEILAKYDMLYLEGYLVFNQNLVLELVEKAKKAGVKVAIDLASYNVVEHNRTFLHDIISKYVDIVFANEEEAFAFTGKNAEEAIHEIAALCDIAVVKTGSKGSIIKQGEHLFHVGVINAKSIDTTGAGDLYAAGFLYGYTRNMSLKQCGEIGALLAGNVIEEIGAKISPERWIKIRENITHV